MDQYQAKTEKYNIITVSIEGIFNFILKRSNIYYF